MSATPPVANGKRETAVTKSKPPSKSAARSSVKTVTKNPPATPKAGREAGADDWPLAAAKTAKPPAASASTPKASSAVTEEPKPTADGPTKMAPEELAFLSETRPSALARTAPHKTKCSVRFTDAKPKHVDVPQDQSSPIDVWNVYSPVRYITGRDRRTLQLQCRARTGDILDYCANLFESRAVEKLMEHRKSKNNGKSKEDVRAADPERNISAESAAAASFVMSLWPGFPVESRPGMSIEVEKALPHLFRGTYLCIFNEEQDAPTRCTAALRLLRNYGGDEGSIAIYNSHAHCTIDGYIPLAFIHSVTRGLEMIERHRYVRDNLVQCVTEEGKKISANYTRAFTLHCRAPQKFYVSFIAFDDKDMDLWMRTLSYFVYLNSQCRSYYVAQGR